MAPESTTPAPFRITGNVASDSSFAASAIACSPPAGRSSRTVSGISMSTIWVQ